MGQMMILMAQLDDLDGVDAEATSEGLIVTGDLDAVREFLEDGWFSVRETGMTPEGEQMGKVVSDAGDS